MNHVKIKEINVDNYQIGMYSLMDYHDKAYGYIIMYYFGNKGNVQQSGLLSSFKVASMVFDSMVLQYDKVC